VHIDLTDTNASKISNALLHARRRAGSPSMGMVMTFIIVTDEGDHYDALKVARSVAREHPSRIIGVIRRSARGASNLDAEVSVGDGGSGESVLLRLSGELANHADSVVLPLLLPDSPVVVWWPSKAPENPAEDPIGVLAQRRITDTVHTTRGKAAALLAQCQNYAPGNTDLSWTRLTHWRALLAAALDQYPARVTGGRVAAERGNASADLLVAWLSDRLGVTIERVVSKGPGITDVSLQTGGGDIEINRPDGRLASFSIPNAANRPVALKRRDTAELLAEELRRLDSDEVYAATVANVCQLQIAAEVKGQPKSGKSESNGSTGKSSAKSSTAKSARSKSAAAKAKTADAEKKTSTKKGSATTSKSSGS
jgi:glucose-6-phosphate dehydrogenase assembly protein OpcA